MMRSPVIFILWGFFLVSCAGIQQFKEEHRPTPIHPGWEIYIEIRDTLKANGKTIDYDTLMQSYQAMVQTEHEIPHIDQLMVSLINKRNDNPRIDQMILIFAAKALGSSNFPVPNAYGIFEAILTKDDRLTEWVLAFVAEAIGDYPVDMPEGDKLVDLLETKLSMVLSASGPKKEYFGCHFLAPPKGEYIRSYIANIQSLAMRTSERNHYYLLVANGYAEVDIERALRRLQSTDMPGKGEHPIALMKYMMQNPGQILR
ncbi:MAG: hypothetical protein SWH78_11365 [Thermodesulfobacteriota bacterium]|nr:hypothetical protein [Thermodesulfobacteriota bacterium]